MEKEYKFSPELLQMMLSEERKKFVSALSRGASFHELAQVRKTIHQLNELIDSGNLQKDSDRYTNERNTR